MSTEQTIEWPIPLSEEQLAGVDSEVDLSNYHNRTNRRMKADYTKQFRCNTLICVLENPRNAANIGAVARNVCTLGIGKMYVVDGHNVISDTREKMIKDDHMMKSSSSAIKWIYIRKFATTEECIAKLEADGVVSVVTSPHKTTVEGVQNVNLGEGEFTDKKLAVWFGNESKGISHEAVEASERCVQIETCGIVESMNLAVSTGIVLYTVAQQRREFSGKQINPTEQ